MLFTVQIHMVVHVTELNRSIANWQEIPAHARQEDTTFCSQMQRLVRRILYQEKTGQINLTPDCLNTAE